MQRALAASMKPKACVNREAFEAFSFQTRTCEAFDGLEKANSVFDTSPLDAVRPRVEDSESDINRNTCRSIQGLLRQKKECPNPGCSVNMHPEPPVFTVKPV